MWAWLLFKNRKHICQNWNESERTINTFGWSIWYDSRRIVNIQNNRCFMNEVIGPITSHWIDSWNDWWWGPVWHLIDDETSIINGRKVPTCGLLSYLYFCRVVFVPVVEPLTVNCTVPPLHLRVTIMLYYRALHESLDWFCKQIRVVVSLHLSHHRQ